MKEAEKLQGMRMKRLAKLGHGVGNGSKISLGKHRAEADCAQTGSKSRTLPKERNHVAKISDFEIDEIVCIDWTDF